MIIELFLDFHPPKATSQHKGVRVMRVKKTNRTIVQFFKKSDLKIAEAMLRLQLERYAPAEPMVGPIKMTVTWTFDWFKYELPHRIAGELPQWFPSIGWPDPDNIYKLFGDVLTQLKFWKDDAHVSSLTIQKGRGDRPGIHLRLEPYVKADWYTPPEGQPEVEVEL